MYIDDLLKAMQDYDQKIRDIEEKWKADQEYYKKYYGNGKMYEDEYNKGLAIYSKSKPEEKEKMLKTIITWFDNMTKKVNDFIVGDSFSEDFIKSLEVFKNIGSALTENEVKAYLNKFNKNYSEFRVLTVVAKEKADITVGYSHYDDVLKSIEEFKGHCINWLTDYSAFSIATAMFISDNHNNPLRELETILKSFFEFEFFVVEKEAQDYSMKTGTWDETEYFYKPQEKETEQTDNVNTLATVIADIENSKA